MINIQVLDQLLGDLELQKKSSVNKRLLLTGPASSQTLHFPTDQGDKTSRSYSKQRPNISETVKAKLTLGAKILQAGGVDKIFRRVFSVREGERLLKASQCYLSTTAGPISGLLFISTDKIAFCSDRSIKLPSPTGEKHRFRYKVSIPLRKIARANQSENVMRPSEKYLQVVTTDDFEFWFIGFLNYKRMFKCLHQAISHA